MTTANKPRAAQCRHCGKTIRRSGRLADRSPAYATPSGLDPAADGHPWYCDDAPHHRHEP